MFNFLRLQKVEADSQNFNNPGTCRSSSESVIHGRKMNKNEGEIESILQLRFLFFKLHWRVCVQHRSFSTTLEARRGRRRDASQVSPNQQTQGNATGQVS